MANTYMHGDGTFQKYGTAEATAGAAGEYSTLGPMRMVELTLADMTTVTATAAIQDDNVWLPVGARIEKVTVIDVTASTGATAVLNIGLQKEDRSTQLDYDGLVAAIPLASVDAAGETTELVVGSTYAGALIGTTLAFKGYLTADYDTAAFTAGKVIVRVYFSFPTS